MFSKQERRAVFILYSSISILQLSSVAFMAPKQVAGSGT